MREQNAQFAAGKVGQSPTGGRRRWSTPSPPRAVCPTVDEFENIIVRAADGSPPCACATWRASSWAPRTTTSTARVNGKQATLIGVFLQPGANALDVAKEAKPPWPTGARFPPGLTYAIPYDTTRFVKVSIREVVKTLGEAMAWCSSWCSCSCRTGAPR
jgi:multidrug efflux pump